MSKEDEMLYAVQNDNLETLKRLLNVANIIALEEGYIKTAKVLLKKYK